MQNHTETPSLSASDLRLIELYFEPEITPKQIAATLGISLVDLLASLERPDIAATIDRLTALDLRRARHLSISLLPDNIRRLQHIAETSKNDEVARKAASAVVRFALRRETPGRAAQPRPPRADDVASDESIHDSSHSPEHTDASSSGPEPEPCPSHARRESPSPSADIPDHSHASDADRRTSAHTSPAQLSNSRGECPSSSLRPTVQ